MSDLTKVKEALEFYKHKWVDVQGKSIPAERLLCDKGVKAKEALAELNKHMDDDELVSALKPFADMHCRDNSCGCNNCIARRAILKVT